MERCTAGFDDLTAANRDCQNVCRNNFGTCRYAATLVSVRRGRASVSIGQLSSYFHQISGMVLRRRKENSGI